MTVLPNLQYGDLVVRPIRVADWRALDRELELGREWLYRWEATQPGIWGRPDTRSAVRTMVTWMRRGESLSCVVVWQGEIVGQVSVSQVFWGSLRSCSIGYWVAERMAGRGITPTAVALLCDFLYGVWGMHRIEICMRLENVPSHRVAQKLRFVPEGVRRGYIHIDGAWRDHDVYALLSEDVDADGVIGRLRATP